MATHRDRGFMLLWSLALSALLLVSIIGYYPFLHGTLRMREFSAGNTQQLALARAGINEALWEANFQARAQRVAIAQNCCCGSVCGAQWGTSGKMLVDFDNNGAVTADERDTWAPQSYFNDAEYGAWASCLPPDDTNLLCRRKTRSLTDGVENKSVGSFAVVVNGLNFTQPINPYASNEYPVITATGTTPDGNTQTIRALLQNNAMTYRHAIWSLNDVSFSGIGYTSYVDSYDSSQGAYGATLTSPANYHGTPLNKSQGDYPATHKADIGTHGQFNYDISNYGEKQPHEWADTLPPIAFPAGANSWPLPSGLPVGVTLTNGNLTLSAGSTWTCSGNLRVTSLAINPGATLVMGDACELYITSTGSDALTVSAGGQLRSRYDNKLWIKGGVSNMHIGNTTGGIYPHSAATSATPSDLQIFIDYYDEDLNGADLSYFMQAPAMSATIYAPKTRLALSGTATFQSPPIAYDFTFYGAAVAAQLSLEMYDSDHVFAFHYDEALRVVPIDGGSTNPAPCSQAPNFNCFSVKSWRITQ